MLKHNLLNRLRLPLHWRLPQTGPADDKQTQPDAREYDQPTDRRFAAARLSEED